jgi:glycine cleavage system transcriptional repressor
VKKFVVFVIGPDRTGIIAAVSQILFEHGCNLEDVSQTTLQAEFVGIFMAALPDGVTEEALLSALRARPALAGLTVLVRPAGPSAAARPPASVPFVITTIGPDRPGLIAGITGVLADYGVNITNLKAMLRGERVRQEYITFYEVDIPAALDQRVFRAALQERARGLGLDVNLQHREIFEQVHRV